MKKYLLFIFVFFITGCTNLDPIVESTPIVSLTPVPTISPIPTIPVLDHVSFSSVHVIINKQHALDEDYIPDDLVIPTLSSIQDGIYLRREASEALETMFEQAKLEDVSLRLGSGYRSYQTQEGLYNSYVQKDGETLANRYSAKPGESEHQTGLAVDISDDTMSAWLSNRFKDTKEGKWLASNSYRYGYILRYPEDKEEITGYMYEPWHFRYIGIDEALKVYESNLTLEEYYQYP